MSPAADGEHIPRADVFKAADSDRPRAGGHRHWCLQQHQLIVVVMADTCCRVPQRVDEMCTDAVLLRAAALRRPRQDECFSVPEIHNQVLVY